MGRETGGMGMAQRDLVGMVVGRVELAVLEGWRAGGLEGWVVMVVVVLASRLRFCS